MKPKSTEGGRSRVYNAPARDPVQVFFGRETDLEGIESGLLSIAAPRVAIEGLAGVGKTELALQVVYRLAKTDRYPGGIFWLDAATPALDAVWGGDVADALEVPSGPVAERARQVIRRLEAGDQALVVLDNVESWTGDERPAPLPHGPSVHLLVTTQHQGLGGPNAFQHHDLRFLDEAAARAMLLSLSGRDGAAEPGLDALLNHLGGHTLALELAGAYLATYYPSTTAGAYLARLQAGADPEADVTPQVAYARTVEQSLDAIWERLDDDARRAWQIAGVFAPAEATVELLTACGVDEATQRTLRRHHVISLSPTRWSMHRLVRAYGARAGTCEDRAAAEHTFLDAVLTLVRVVDAATGYCVYRENLPQLDHALDLGATALGSDKYSLVLDRVGTGAQSAGDLLRAKDLHERALALDLLIFGEHDRSVAISRSNLAAVLRILGDQARAKDLLEQALESSLRAFGEDHEMVAMGRSNLAAVLYDLDEMAQAKELLDLALTSRLRVHGEQDRDVATLRSNLGNVLFELGDLAQAKSMLEQALASSLRAFDKDHPTVATRQANLAMVLKDLDESYRATQLLEQALASDMARFGEDHHIVAMRHAQIAAALSGTDPQTAKTLLEQALDSDLRTFGEGSSIVAERRAQIAGVLHELGDLPRAKELLEQALASDLQARGESHRVVAMRRASLAAILVDIGDLPRAKQLLEQAIDAAQKKLGDEHPHLITYRENLAEVVKRMNAAAAVAAVRTESKEQRMSETHDVFICHASEDKARFVEPLVAALVGHGLRVWYDRFEIGLGDDVRAKMNEGLRGSRFGVVLVSPSSFKFWPQAELGALFNQEARGTGERPRILPVRCDLSVDELTARDPLLAARRSIGWEEGLDAVARAIVGVVERARAGASAGAGGTAAATSTPPRPAIVAPVTPGSPPVPTSSPTTATRSGGAAQGRLDLGLVIALPEELRQVLALVGDYTRHPSGDLDAYVFTRNGYRCAAVLVGEMGQTQAGVFTERFIAALDPAMIVSMGIAGGLNDLCAGDVHVPSQSVEYLQDAKAAGVAGGGFAIVPGAPAYRVDYALLRAARALEFDHPAAFRAWRADAARDLAALLPDADKRAALLADRDVREEVVALADGHVATGPVVGAARAFADWIRSHDRNVKSLEMEASAVVLAATTRPDPRRAFILRAISDLGDERKKELDGKSNGVLRRWAMNNAVRYLWTLLDVGALPRATPAGTTDA